MIYECIAFIKFRNNRNNISYIFCKVSRVPSNVFLHFELTLSVNGECINYGLESYAVDEIYIHTYLNNNSMPYSTSCNKLINQTTAKLKGDTYLLQFALYTSEILMLLMIYNQE